MLRDKNTTELYGQYKNTIQKAADLYYASAVLGWDQEVYMPPKGFAARTRQLSTLASLAHELVTGGEYGNILKELQGRNDLDDKQQANVRLSLEDYTKKQKLPSSFVAKLAEQTSSSYQAWIDARKANDYSLYAPQLEKMLELKLQEADQYGYEVHPYNALMDEYEKGATVAMLDPVFNDVKKHLPDLLAVISAAPQVDDSFLHKHYCKDKQWSFSIDVLKEMGYDFDAGRQDLSEHPFTTSFSAEDVRVTTRVSEDDFASLLWSSIHEGGHALYEQGLPADQYGMPLGEAASLSVHESQSRIWENNIGRGIQFWKHFYPKLQQLFPDALGEVNEQQFYKGINKVQPSLIRTEADELTYHFHVMIRYEIEKALLTRELNIKDLSGAWNDMYSKYLGVTPPDDKQGVLQDIHWAHGSFGYFPTYSLGSFYAAQYYDKAKADIQDMEHQLATGDYKEILSWLRRNIHAHGRRYTSEELCQEVTGRGLNFKAFMNYATKKYTGVYDIALSPADDGTQNT